MRYVFYSILAVVIVGLIIGAFHLYKVSNKNKKEMAQYANEKVELTKKFNKVLVVYYSKSGRTKDIAERIQTKTNADLYEIQLDEELPSAAKLHLAIREQLKSKNFPKVKDNLPDFEKYDVIFVGAPVWWYTVATPALSFLQQADFKGKKVVPFSTQGSNVGAYFEDFKEYAKNADIKQGESFNNMPQKYDEAVDNKILVWLNSL